MVHAIYKIVIIIKSPKIYSAGIYHTDYQNNPSGGYVYMEKQL